MSWLRDTLLRLLPHARPTGLIAAGHPDGQSPVLVTGNFTLTVRRLLRALEGHDAWVLVADSRGINVWCAATGGHFTHHDVIAAVRVSRLAEKVSHRRLVLPQLAATGVETAPIEQATGFEAQWGPVHLEDLPQFLDRGGKVHKGERSVRFGLRDRLEMSLMWAPAMALVLGLGLGGLLGWREGLTSALVTVLGVVGLFAALPIAPVGGRRGWVTLATTALLMAGAGVAVLALTGGVGALQAEAMAGGAVVAMGILSVDIAGTTPRLPSTINSLGTPFEVELVETRCTGAAVCVQVCPVEVLQMDGKRRKVRIAQPDVCVRCGACIVQCPEDALQFRFADGRVVDAQTVRTTKLNMLGRRSVRV